MREINIGDKESLTKVITEETILQTADWSGDYNLMHMDEQYASSSMFGRRIAHGLICLGMVSNILGNKLPGSGAILINQTVEYKAPVYIGDKITASVCVTDYDKGRRKVSLQYFCNKEDGIVVVKGTVLCKL